MNWDRDCGTIVFTGTAGRNLVPKPSSGPAVERWIVQGRVILPTLAILFSCIAAEPGNGQENGIGNGNHGNGEQPRSPSLVTGSSINFDIPFTRFRNLGTAAEALQSYRKQVIRQIAATLHSKETKVLFLQDDHGTVLPSCYLTHLNSQNYSQLCNCPFHKKKPKRHDSDDLAISIPRQHSNPFPCYSGAMRYPAVSFSIAKDGKVLSANIFPLDSPKPAFPYGGQAALEAFEVWTERELSATQALSAIKFDPLPEEYSGDRLTFTVAVDLPGPKIAGPIRQGNKTNLDNGPGAAPHTVLRSRRY